MFGWLKKKSPSPPPVLRSWEPGKRYDTADGGFMMMSPLASEFGDPSDPETHKKLRNWCRENFPSGEKA